MLETIDLNLLYYLSIVLDEGNVSRAAKRLKITQSALSNALARARTVFGDELLVRSGRCLVPTPFARMIREPLQDALNALERNVLHKRAFNPKCDDFRFYTAFRGYEEAILFPQLIEHLNVFPALSIFNRSPRSMHVVQALAAGTVHFTLTPYLNDHVGIVKKKFLVDDFVCVAGPLFEQTDLTLEAFCNYGHILVALYGGPGIVDEELEKIGRRRQVAVTVGEFSSVPILLKSSPLLATVPSALARLWKMHYPVRLLPCPVQLKPLTLYLSWHKNAEASPELVWFKEQLDVVKTKVLSL